MLKIPLGLLVILFCAAAVQPAGAAGTLWGISDSGLEFGKGLVAGRNYAVPDPAYYLQHGVKLVRIPFQILRLQPDAGGPLAANVVFYLQKIIAEDHEAGAITVLDPHGYGFYVLDGKPQDILTNLLAAADYVDLMSRIAATFAHDDVAIGLMNEPHTGSDADYAPLWNQAIAAIRKAGFHGVILVPHAHWGTAADIAPLTPFAGNIIDPDRNWVLEVHSYLDPDGTGTYRQPVTTPAIGAARLAGAIAWSRQSGTRLFLGETGVPATPPGLAGFQMMADEIAATPEVFWGVAVWGAGPWWKPNYPMRLDPVNGVTQPQFTALQNIISPEMLYFASDSTGANPQISIEINGRKMTPPVTIQAPRSTAPQPVPVPLPLAPGLYVVNILPVSPAAGGQVYIVGANWKGRSDSDDAFGIVTSNGYKFKIKVPE